MKIYLVGQGEYFDYRIIGVFDKKTLAQKFIKTIGDPGEFVIETHRLNPHKAALDKNYKPYIVEIQSDGKILNFKESYFKWDWYSEDERQIEYDSFNKVFTIPLFARDENHAIKIAIDIRRRSIVIAKNKVVK